MNRHADAGSVRKRTVTEHKHFFEVDFCVPDAWLPRAGPHIFTGSLQSAMFGDGVSHFF
jgi:hypothetical protein